MGKIIALADTGFGAGKFFFGANLCAISGGMFLDIPEKNVNASLIFNFPLVKNASEIIAISQDISPNILKGYFGTKNQPVLVKPDFDTSSTQILSKLLKQLAKTSSFIFVPLVEDIAMQNLIHECAMVLLFVEPHAFGVARAKDFINSAAKNFVAKNAIKPVLCRKNIVGQMKTMELAQAIDSEIFAEIIYSDKDFIDTLNSPDSAPLSNTSFEFVSGIKNLIDKISKEECSAQVMALHENQNEIYKVFGALKERIHKELIEKMDLRSIRFDDTAGLNEVRQKAKKIVDELISLEKSATLTYEIRAHISKEVLDQALGLGVLEELIANQKISEILVNGPNKIFIEENGKLKLSNVKFESVSGLKTVIDRILAPIGRRIDEASPLVDARLSDGSRVNAVIEPVSLSGPLLSIRKFFKRNINFNDLISFGAASGEMADLLKVCVMLRKNIIVSGGTGSGKTTLLNALATFIGTDERIVTIEDSAELKLSQEHVVRLEARPQSIEGKGEISIRRLVINALRMRPDRIIVGECRGGEALDMLQAMNTGHDGSLTTVHANTAKDAVSRIITMVMMSGMELPEKAIKEQICSAVQIIVQLARYQDGSRKISQIAKLSLLPDGSVQTTPVFGFEQTGYDGKTVQGSFKNYGITQEFEVEAKSKGIL